MLEKKQKAWFFPCCFLVFNGRLTYSRDRGSNPKDRELKDDLGADGVFETRQGTMQLRSLVCIKSSLGMIPPDVAHLELKFST